MSPDALRGFVGLDVATLGVSALRASRSGGGLDSLAFAFFITAVLDCLIPLEMARSALHVTLGTLLQLAFDVPSSMLGTCPCAHRALPDFVQGCCRGVALVCLSVHTCASLIFALLGAGLLAFVGMLGGTNGDVVWHGFVETKLNAFVAALPTAVLMYALVRKCEAGGPRVLEAGHAGAAACPGRPPPPLPPRWIP